MLQGGNKTIRIHEQDVANRPLPKRYQIATFTRSLPLGPDNTQDFAFCTFVINNFIVAFLTYLKKERNIYKSSLAGSVLPDVAMESSFIL